MDFEQLLNFAGPRIAVGAGIIAGSLLVGWLAKFLLLPLLVLILAVAICFMLGDWALYVWEHEAELIEKLKKAWNS